MEKVKQGREGRIGGVGGRVAGGGDEMEKEEGKENQLDKETQEEERQKEN